MNIIVKVVTLALCSGLHVVYTAEDMLCACVHVFYLKHYRARFMATIYMQLHLHIQWE